MSKDFIDQIDKARMQFFGSLYSVLRWPLRFCFMLWIALFIVLFILAFYTALNLLVIVALISSVLILLAGFDVFKEYLLDMVVWRKKNERLGKSHA